MPELTTTLASWLPWITGGTVMYFLPTLMAAFNRNASPLVVGLVNTFYGWSIVGWLIVFAASLADWDSRFSRSNRVKR